MRVNLKCPFSEKDQAKALGAKWDAAAKTWFVENAPDIKQFMRWLGGNALDTPDQLKAIPSKKKRPVHRKPAGHNNGFATIGRHHEEDLTEYDVPPWEDVDDWQAIKALREACA